MSVNVNIGVSLDEKATIDEILKELKEKGIYHETETFPGKLAQYQRRFLRPKRSV
jgi:hypothetical protein